MEKSLVVTMPEACFYVMAGEVGKLKWGKDF